MVNKGDGDMARIDEEVWKGWMTLCGEVFA